MDKKILFGDYKESLTVKSKLLSIDEAVILRDSDKLRVLNIGSYDIMHPGQIITLNFSKNLREAAGLFPEKYDNLTSLYQGRLAPENIFMMVAVNSNESYRRLNEEYKKHSRRKISTHDENERVWQLANLSCVDGIVLFDSLTAEPVISAYRPHILTKGGDYVLDPKDAAKDRPAVDQEEKRLAEKYGGLVITMPLGTDCYGKPYHSYHHFVQRILRNHRRYRDGK